MVAKLSIDAAYLHAVAAVGVQHRHDGGEVVGGVDHHAHNALWRNHRLVVMYSLTAALVYHNVIVALVPGVFHHLGLSVAVALFIHRILMHELAHVVAYVRRLQLCAQLCILGCQQLVLVSQPEIVANLCYGAIAASGNHVTHPHNLRTLIIAVLRYKDYSQYLQQQEDEHIIIPLYKCQ